MKKVAELRRGRGENKEGDEAGKDNECEQEAGAVEVNSICEKLLSSARDAAKEIEQRLQPRLLRIMNKAVSTDHAKRDLYKTKRITTIQQQITELEQSMEQMKTVLQHLQSAANIVSKLPGEVPAVDASSHNEVLEKWKSEVEKKKKDIEDAREEINGQIRSALRIRVGSAVACAIATGGGEENNATLNVILEECKRSVMENANKYYLPMVQKQKTEIMKEALAQERSILLRLQEEYNQQCEKLRMFKVYIETEGRQWQRLANMAEVQGSVDIETRRRELLDVVIPSCKEVEKEMNTMKDDLKERDTEAANRMNQYDMILQEELKMNIGGAVFTPLAEENTSQDEESEEE